MIAAALPLTTVAAVFSWTGYQLLLMCFISDSCLRFWLETDHPKGFCQGRLHAIGI